MSAPTLTRAASQPKTAATHPPARIIAEYKMPEVHVGQLVNWFETPATVQPCAAFVTKVYDAGVDLSVMVPGATNLWVKYAAPWRHDPKPWRTETAEEGCWDFIPAKKTTAAMDSKVADELVELRLRVQALEQAAKAK